MRNLSKSLILCFPEKTNGFRNEEEVKTIILLYLKQNHQLHWKLSKLQIKPVTRYVSLWCAKKIISTLKKEAAI